MPTFLLTEPDCVFIHIPKTGGQSIRYGVWGGARPSEPAFGFVPDQWMHLFKFAFVRHPLDRFVSAWKMFTDGSTDFQCPSGKESRKLEVREQLSVDDFAAIVFDESIPYDQRPKTFEERVRQHTIPQTHEFNCLRFADFIGRFEAIDRDFGVVRERLRITTPLPKLNHTVHGHWSEYLQGDLLARCIDYFERDMRELGYEE